MICDYCEREHEENGLWVYQREDLDNITLCDDCWAHTLTLTKEKKNVGANKWKK